MATAWRRWCSVLATAIIAVRARYVAIQESDIFLQRLLAIDGLHIVSGPALSFSDLTGGYELRRFVVGC